MQYANEVKLSFKSIFLLLKKPTELSLSLSYLDRLEACMGFRKLLPLHFDIRLDFVTALGNKPPEPKLVTKLFGRGHLRVFPKEVRCIHKT